MDPQIITITNFLPKFELVAKDLKVKPGSKTAGELRSLISQAVSIARPKAVYKIVSIERQENHCVLLDNVQFQSRVLSKNLDGVHRGFLFVASCGVELDQWKDKFNNIMDSYFADVITGLALRSAAESLFNQITQRFGLKKTASMNPGSLEDWPLQAQSSLFSLLGDPQKHVGVYLTESLMMVPRHSLSGILFETETDYVNCQLCSREGCPNRRAPYNEELVKQYQNGVPLHQEP